MSNAAEVGAAMIFFTTAMASALVVAAGIEGALQLAASRTSRVRNFAPACQACPREIGGLRAGCSLRLPRKITCGSLAHQSKKAKRFRILLSKRHWRLFARNHSARATESAEEARALWSAVQDHFAVCKLVLHPEKTKIVYCKDANRRGDFPNQSFDFLGFSVLQAHTERSSSWTDQSCG